VTVNLPAASLPAVAVTVGVEIVVAPSVTPRAGVVKFASPDWMVTPPWRTRDAGFSEDSSIVIRLSARRWKRVPSARRISAEPPEPVRTMSALVSMMARSAFFHSRVPPCRTSTLPS
jgi:hypothetical protein